MSKKYYDINLEIPGPFAYSYTVYSALMNYCEKYDFQEIFSEHTPSTDYYGWHMHFDTTYGKAKIFWQILKMLAKHEAIKYATIREIRFDGVFGKAYRRALIASPKYKQAHKRLFQDEYYQKADF